MGVIEIFVFCSSRFLNFSTKNYLCYKKVKEGKKEKEGKK